MSPIWFAEGLENGTIMRVCWQQWSMVEVPCKFGAALLQMKLEIWSGLMVSLMLGNTGRYSPSCSTIREACDWPPIHLKHTAKGSRTIFRALISTSRRVSGITWREKDLRKSASTEDLWLVQQDVWNNLHLLSSFKSCVQVYREDDKTDAVLMANGGNSKYWFECYISVPEPPDRGPVLVCGSFGTRPNRKNK